MDLLSQQGMRPAQGARARVDEMPEVPHVHEMSESVQHEWRKRYSERFAENIDDFRDDPIRRKQDALRHANRLLRTLAINSFEEAMALPDWQILATPDGARVRYKDRAKGGNQRLPNGRELYLKPGQLVLKLVTIDGKKYTFPIPDGATESLPSAPIPPPIIPVASAAVGGK